MSSHDQQASASNSEAGQPQGGQESRQDGCCTDFYGHPLVRWIAGDSLHPGGLALTTHLAQFAGIDQRSVVLDLGCGSGTSALHIARTLGCRITGLTLEADGIRAASEAAAKEGVTDRVAFLQGDLLSADLPASSYDVALMECVLSTMLDKEAALRRCYDLLKPGGRLALSDVITEGEISPELADILGRAGCVGGAIPLRSYEDCAVMAGFEPALAEDVSWAAADFVSRVGMKLALAEVVAQLGKVPFSQRTIQGARRAVAGIQECVDAGVLGYGLLVARKAGGPSVLPLTQHRRTSHGG